MPEGISRDSKKNWNFIQFNKAMPQIIIRLSINKPKAIPIYMALVSLSNSLGCSVVSQSKIARQVGKSTRTVARLLNYLAAKGFIAIARSGRANVYILNYGLIWKNMGYKKKFVGKYITFPANVIISEPQNKKFFESFRKFVKENGHKYIDLSKVKQKKVTLNKDPNKSKKLKEEHHRKLTRNNTIGLYKIKKPVKKTTDL